MVYLCELHRPAMLASRLYFIAYPWPGRPLLLAGNSSLPFNLSGMYCEGIALTNGRYGFVTFFRVLLPPTAQSRIELYLL